MQRVTRLAAAAFLLVAGGIHLQLWRTGYRGIPYIGPLFLANVVVSAGLVLAVLRGADAGVTVAGMVFCAVSLLALVLSRTIGLLGFTERAWTHLALQATTAEIGAAVALAVALTARRRQGSQPAPIPVRTGR